MCLYGYRKAVNSFTSQVVVGEEFQGGALAGSLLYQTTMPMQQSERCMEPSGHLLGGLIGHVENYRLGECEIRLGNRD